MPIETRLYLAVASTRERMRAGQPASGAAEALSHILDVPYERVHALAVTAETECAKTREALTAEHERRTRELRACGIVSHE